MTDKEASQEETIAQDKPTVSVDCVVFGLDEGDLKVALIQRKTEPFKDKWALPGGWVGLHESVENAAYRVLKQETDIDTLYLEQLYTFGDLNRDSRARVVTVAYFALVNLYEHPIHAAMGAAEGEWIAVKKLPELAFDHQRIMDYTLDRLKNKVHYEPVGFELLPRKFTLTQLQKLYETVWERKLDKRNFRKKILKMGILLQLDETEKDVAHRAARLYRFDEEKYNLMKQEGFYFEL